MGTYTIELRRVCDIFTREEVESWFKSYNISDYLTITQIESINKAGLWNKDKLAKKIVDAYFMREIGFETPYLFRHYVIAQMNAIMEEKLPLIYTNSIEYNPLINVDYTETFSRTASGNSINEGSSTSNSSNNASGLNVASDTPQGQISKTAILNGSYASSTNASETQSNIEDTTNTNNTFENSNKEEYTRNFKGNQGISATYQAMIKQYRQNIIAIDNEIIKALDILFMGIF